MSASNHDLTILRRNYNDALAAAVLWHNKYEDARGTMTPNLTPAANAPTAAPIVYYNALDAYLATHAPPVADLAVHASLRADRDLWRQRVADTRELIDLVADLAADPTPATTAALITYYRAWRGLVEANIPVTWAEPAPAVLELAGAEVPV